MKEQQMAQRSNRWFYRKFLPIRWIAKSIGKNIDFQVIKWNLEMTLVYLRIHQSSAIN
ncbi:hypothetical protein [Sphingobacterium siyangense]|uniref:hypothetical protein n=1 Tax=Sphingobacterium siyangense TaxID=459529 RepID=UPI0031F881EE